VKHKFAPWALVSPLSGRLVTSSSYNDAGGYQCIECRKTIITWRDRDWEGDGNITRRYTNEEPDSEEDCTPVPRTPIMSGM